MELVVSRKDIQNKIKGNQTIHMKTVSTLLHFGYKW